MKIRSAKKILNIMKRGTDAPSANVSVFRAILRNSKECSRCKHYEGNEFVGRCIKLHVDAESNDWCAGAFFVKK